MAPKYELLEMIGEGGAGSVFRARAPSGALVAVKLLKKLGSADAVARFQREQRLLGQLGEVDGFVPLLDAGIGPNGPWLVMPLLVGGTLRERLARPPRYTVAQAVGVCGRIAAAMGRAHARGLVHRDLKPENVLFGRRGSGPADQGPPLVADLGLAKHWRRDLPGASLSIALSRPGEFAGTAGYTAPEQMLSSRDATPAADVFSLGAILYECLTGKYAFAGETFAEIVASVQSHEVRPIQELCPECPDELSAIVEKALATFPDDRFPDASAVARALAACPIVRRPPGPPPVPVDSDAGDSRGGDSRGDSRGESTGGHTVADSRPTGASVFEWREPDDATPRRLWLLLVAGACAVTIVVCLAGVALSRARQADGERERVAADVHEVRKLAQLARERAETPGPQALAAAESALALLAALPPERRERALEAEVRESVAWGYLARGSDGLAVAAAGSALAFVASDSPAAGSLQLLRARALLRSGKPEEALGDLARLGSLEARRLRAETLLALRRWSELEDLPAASDDLLGTARAWARFRLSNDVARAREDMKALGPSGREMLAGALRLGEARERLLALPVPGDYAEVGSRPARPFEAIEGFGNAVLAAWHSPHRALLDRAEDSAALEHALQLFVVYSKTFTDFAQLRSIAAADHIEEALRLVDLEGSSERARDSIWVTQLFESLYFFGRLTGADAERRNAAQAERLAAIRLLPGPFTPDVEYARARALAVAATHLARQRKVSQSELSLALERVIDASPRGATIFADQTFAEVIWRWSLAQASCRAAAQLEGGSERQRLLLRADAQLSVLRQRALDPDSRRDLNALDFLVALVRGDDARTDELLRRFDLEPRAGATPSELGRSANELFLVGELRRRQGRPAEAELWLERAVKLRSVPANSEGNVEATFVVDPLLAYGLLLVRDPARRDEGLARLERIVSRESEFPPALPWLEAEAHAALGK